MKKQKERFVFFQINDADQFKNALKTYVPEHITSTATLISPPAQQPLAFVNVAFSNTGLRTLGITDNLGDPEFSTGMFADAQDLGDDLNQWAAPFTGTVIHGVFLIGTDQVSSVENQYRGLCSSFRRMRSWISTQMISTQPSELPSLN